ncbi:MAG: hypothetical protein H6605_00940 [Flavobacteriales bacterium]|nr:hypothetical protein [Flavobacteriales bacterium]
MRSSSFFSHGKILISGEYLVMDGALSLALPTKLGQHMEVVETEGEGFLIWTAFRSDQEKWFSEEFKISHNGSIAASKFNEQTILFKALNVAHEMNPSVYKSNRNYNVVTRLEFPNDWGLGSSSTFITNLSHWFRIEPYELFKKIWNGSGYDIAVAEKGCSILYHLKSGAPIIQTVQWEPEFKDELLFVYLGKKQLSEKEIGHYKQKKVSGDQISRISSLTIEILKSKNLEKFQELIGEHESIISEVLERPTLQSGLFEDYKGTIKSLGAWGGDFILTGKSQGVPYFTSKGYHTFFSWDELIQN